VNNSTSASSNNSIDTKTRQSKRQALKNILLGPVRSEGRFHNPVPLTPSEAHVNDPIFYYIQSSQNCPCEYHDQIRRIEGERAVTNLSKTISSNDQSKASSATSSLYETPIRSHPELDIPQSKVFKVNADVHNNSLTSNDKIQIIHNFETRKEHFPGKPVRKYSLGQNRPIQYDPIVNFSLPFSVSTTNIGEIANQHMKNSLIRKNVRKFSLDLPVWTAHEEKKNVTEPEEITQDEGQFLNVIDEFNAAISQSLRKPSAILSARKLSLNIPQPSTASEFETKKFNKSGSLTNLSLVDQVNFIPIKFERSEESFSSAVKPDNQRINRKIFQTDLNLPSLIVEESLKSRSPTPSREISKESRENVVVLKISHSTSDLESFQCCNSLSSLSPSLSIENTSDCPDTYEQIQCLSNVRKTNEKTEMETNSTKVNMIS